ncbi:hypothetical protein CORC01_06038 [Colletotrichum orchidophilum]|uniref:D-isomer specific 2-hydroxyacid dehydrogenase catalytic domain-containing protein n=1 Tax=Colletotrichum orchidophilum TaxID=1209926 RepID=A0A1G4BB06_9PEZI|nr:uncharacterized protein CORC01_06038 [Colletotrichum orchidophilum]OHE98587.1 hypothetical protein CORC01_06038 [Colletotrichum orchidophilum]
MATERDLDGGVRLSSIFLDMEFKEADGRAELLATLNVPFQDEGEERSSIKAAKDFDQTRLPSREGLISLKTGRSTSVAGKFDENSSNHFPPSLKYICHTDAGYDQIDINACTRRDIIVTRRLNPAFNILRILQSGTSKKVSSCPITPRQDVGNPWHGLYRPSCQAPCQTRRARDDVSQPEAAARRATSDCSYAPADELFSTSDITSVHVPLSAGTPHMIVLNEGIVAAVGLDVYEKEPLVDERLVKNH